MNNSVNNIAKGKNLESALPTYANYMMNLYNKMAHIQFSMNYYTYYEMIAEYSGKNKNELDDILARFNEIIKNAVINHVTGDDREKAVSGISRIRDEVTDNMRVLTTFIDVFSRYEYIFNRIEYRFEKNNEASKYSDEEMARKIMRYIISDEDNAVINGKISEIIGQLPVRMVKNKFYEYVNEGVNVYSEAGKQSFDDYIYMLRTTALLDKPEGFDSRFEELAEILKDLGAVKFSEITEEGYQNMSQKMIYVTETANELVDIYMMLADLINAVYVIVLASPYIEETTETSICKNITKNIFSLFLEGDYATIDEETEKLMMQLEGVPERVGMEASSAEYALDTVKSEYMDMASSVMCGSEYEALFICQKLLSGSLFVDIDEKITDDTLETSYFEDTKKKLLADLEEAFKNNEKMLNRAIMAAVLSMLPVFFNNMEEVKEYVMTSLDNCRDEAEKSGCIEIINSIIEA